MIRYDDNFIALTTDDFYDGRKTNRIVDDKGLESLCDKKLHDEIHSIVYDKEADFFLSIDKLCEECKDYKEWMKGLTIPFKRLIQHVYSDNEYQIGKKYQEELLNHLKKINKELIKSLWQAYFKRVEKMTELNMFKEAGFRKYSYYVVYHSFLKLWRDLCWRIQDAIDKIKNIEGSEEFIDKYVKFIDENSEILYRNIGILLKINKIKTEKTLKAYLKENHDKDVISEEKVFNKKLLWLIYKKKFFMINRYYEVYYVGIDKDKDKSREEAIEECKKMNDEEFKEFINDSIKRSMSIIK